MKDNERVVSSQEIHEILKKRKQIALIWGTDDVLDIRSDLTINQAWKVLQEVSRRNAPAYGVSYTTLECIADELFPRS